MNAQRAMEIYKSSDRIVVQLDGTSVWIENVDVENGMATVQVGQKPTDVYTVSVDRLQEQEH